jgi:nitroimidazol reductase NimA-like FMN-containing flavoprotein (pyridoxamine 5'-phosphate oxidase superfamily)
MKIAPLNYVPPDKTGKLTPEELTLFLAQPWNARLATVTPDHRPYVVPIWYQHDAVADLFYVIGRERAAYIEHIRHNPAVALHIADDVHLAHTRVLVEGQAHIIEGPVAPASSPRLEAMVADMARRYMGDPGPGYSSHTNHRPRYLIGITPETVQSWTGGEWAAKYFR